MPKYTTLSSPLLLGFEDLERLIDRAGKAAGDGYPPYNIERIANEADTAQLLKISLAVAGFKRDQLDISVTDKQLTISGRQDDDDSRDFLHRGIAARQFQRTFVLADGIEVADANLSDGLLIITLRRPEPAQLVRKIEIRSGKIGQEERPANIPAIGIKGQRVIKNRTT